MSISEVTYLAALAQSAYSTFSADRPDIRSLVLNDGGEFSAASASRFLGLTGNGNGPFGGGLLRVAHEPDQLNGFSATVFRRNDTGQAILAIRGSNGISDFIQDAKIGVIGFASDQLISLYRYYRSLTTPAGQAVTYSDSEKDLLHRLNTPISLPSPINFLTNLALDAQLAFDKGMGVLQPGEQLVVTGHSLGGHLALLFGRVFPTVTEAVFTFNAPGILPWGDSYLTGAGVGPNDPSRVTNVISANGIDATAAIGSKPGETIRIFNEATSSAVHNHSVARQSDALALYDLFGALSPFLGQRVSDITAILAASSAIPTETLERALDMLGLATGASDSETPTAVSSSDQAARESYFSKLYSLRDSLSGNGDWEIVSLAGLTPVQLFGLHFQGPGVRYALSELMPFAVLGGEFDDSLQDLSREWLWARTEFLSELSTVRTADVRFGVSAADKDFAFVDADQNLRLALLSPTAGILAQSQGSEERIESFLAGLSYDRVTVFGSDVAENPDSISGSPGGDRLFGNAGSDTLDGLGGDDQIEDGAGADLLIGGTGNDSYLIVQDANVDRIRDADGSGTVKVEGSLLTGGFKRPDGVYASGDGLHTYTFTGNLGSGGTLTVNVSLIIENFHNGDLGIHLGATPDLDATGTDYTYIGGWESMPEDDEDAWGNLVATGPANVAANDTYLYGRPGNTRFDTGDGNDYVDDVHGGDDDLILGAGSDRGFGGDGDDWIEGGDGSDQLYGGAGNDVIIASVYGEDLSGAPSSGEGLFIDRLEGGGGEDTLVGSWLRDVIDSGAESDLVFSGAGNDTVDAGAGNDSIFSGAGSDSVAGGEGGDELHADLGVDVLDGQGGDDILYAGPGTTDLFGGNGNDTLIAAGFFDRLRGGSGADLLQVTGSSVIWLGDGDHLEYRFGISQIASVNMDGASPGAVTISFSSETMPVDVFSVGAGASPGWGLFTKEGTSGLVFNTPFSQWSGVAVEFADGTTWSAEDIAAHAGSVTRANALPPLPGSGEGGEAGVPVAGPGDHVYYVGDGGRETISDYAGSDMVVFTAHRSDDVSVFSTGSDLLLRYEGGEVRLLGEIDAANGIEAVTFASDDVTWDRATLAANAIELPETQSGPLGIEVVAPGAAFSFTIGEETFANEYAIGDTRLEATDLQGGALPTWLTFDAEQGTFSGTPAAADAGVTAVLVALRDESGVVAVAPLVIAVEAGEETGGGGGGEETPPAAPPTVPVSEDAPPMRTVLTQSDFFDLPAVLPAPFASVEAVPLVGAIDDPVYRSIERLLSAPATLHAPVFLERYAEAVREFRERHPVPEEAPVEPLPTDEEMAGYNASLHAWLDADQRRLAAAAHEGGWDFGGMEMNWVHPGSGIDRLLGGGSEAFARPGLPALPVIHQQPGLREGLVSLGG